MQKDMMFRKLKNILIEISSEMLCFSCILPANAYLILLERFHTSIRQSFEVELHDCLKRP